MEDLFPDLSDLEFVDIVGIWSPGLQAYQPTHDEVRAELWMFNNFYMGRSDLVPDRIFEIHRDSTPVVAGHVWNAQGPIFAQYQRPIYTAIDAEWPGLPRQWRRIFPFAEIMRDVDMRAFTCTMSYLLAFAMHCHVKKVRLFGMLMLDEVERRQQLPGFMHMIRVVKEAGMEVVVAPLLWAQWETLAASPGYSLEATPFPGPYGLEKIEARHHQWIAVWEQDPYTNKNYHAVLTPNKLLQHQLPVQHRRSILRQREDHDGASVPGGVLVGQTDQDFAESGSGVGEIDGI
jgi:hypothetical protein